MPHEKNTTEKQFQLRAHYCLKVIQRPNLSGIVNEKGF